MTSIPSDMAARGFVYSLMDVARAGTLVDLGCGNGYDLQQISRTAPDRARLIGLDSSEGALATAGSRTIGDRRFTFTEADLSGRLPFADGECDIVFSKNLLECIPDKQAHLREIHRILKPGGQVVCAHYDWDSQMIDGGDKSLVRRIVPAFGDWKQGWMNDCDAWMGRRLWRTFQQSGLFEGAVQAHVLTETEFTPGKYGYEAIHSFRTLVRAGKISPDEFDRFYTNVESLAAEDRYFYSITMFVYVGASAVR